MKQCTVMILAILWLSSAAESTPAQTGWQWRYPLPQGNSLFDVEYFSGNIAIAVGASSTVIVTADGGDSWTVTANAAGFGVTLRAVCMIDALTALAVGDGGVVIRTVDGGITWSVQASGTFADLYDVTFVSPNIGYAVGGAGTMLKTIDGGISWNSISSGVGAILYGVSFAHPDIGTVVGSEGTILRTTDGGSSWSNQTSGTTGPLYTAQMISVDTGYAAGRNLVLKTTDGGATWNAVDTSFGWDPKWVDVSFIDADTGFVIGTFISYDNLESAVFISTTDGGSSWTVRTDVNSALLSVSRLDYWKGLAVGAAGTIMRTSDGGLTWSIVGGPDPTTAMQAAYMRGLDFWDIDKGIAIVSTDVYQHDNSFVLKTSDGGDTWVESGVPIPGHCPSLRLLDIAYADETTVYAVGHETFTYCDDGAVMSRSFDGGETWDEDWLWSGGCWPGNPYCVESLYGIDFGDAGHGVAVGDGGWVVTIRSGVVSQVATGTGVTLNGVAMPDAARVFAVGGGGTILRSDDGGDTWIPQVSGVTASLNAVDFSYADFGTIVGSDGTILRTWDGGNQWLLQTSGTTDNLAAVSFCNPMVGFIIGRSGTILKTVDGGATWTIEPGPIDRLADVHTINQYNLIIVGGHWDILSKRGSGPPGVQTECPADVTIPTNSTIRSLSLVGFHITNVGGISCAYDYYVTATGPALLVDEGNPASLSGRTPVLAPGATYYPPEAGLLIPAIRDYAQQRVAYHATVPEETAVSDSCVTVVTFMPPVPVFISWFDATAFASGVKLSWDIDSDEDVMGFKIYRSVDGNPASDKAAPGAVLPPEARTYTDGTVSGGKTYRYTLGVVLADGSESISQTVMVKTKAYELALHQNHPNPFNPSTKIGFTLAERARTNLSVYNIEGRLVASLVEETLAPGVKEVTWHGTDARGNQVSTGVYFYRLTTGNRTLTKKMVFLK